MGLLIALVGVSGSGKTTVCRRVAERRRAAGRPCAGFLAERRTAAGSATGLDLLDLVSGDRVPLAEFDVPTGGPVTGRWHFHEQAFRAGRAWFDAAAPDVAVVVDEIGPLELLQARGWFPLLQRLIDRPGPAVVSVRPTLADALTHAVPGCAVERVAIDDTTRTAAEARVLALLEQEP